MADHTVDPDDFDPDAAPSKSELKRRMSALQELGTTLTQLSDKQLRRIPIADPRLAEAIRETRNISSNSARRRHLQFIGKLMRDIDSQPIQAALEDLDRERAGAAHHFQQLEALRDQLLAQGLPGIDAIMARWPHADRQHLRQLLLQDQREQQRNKPPASRRKLFRYLRELDDASGTTPPAEGDGDGG